MLPSEITGPGPGATRVDAYDVREQERRNRQADADGCPYVFPRFERKQCVLANGHDGPHQTRRWP